MKLQTNAFSHRATIDKTLVIIRKRRILLFLLNYNDVRDFEVFIWTAWCIFNCETKKIKQTKNIKTSIFKQKPFCVV